MKKTVIVLGALTVTCLATQPAYAKGGDSNASPLKGVGHAVASTSSDLSINMGDDGRFDEGAYAGTSREFRLSYEWPDIPQTGFTTIRVNGNDTAFTAGSTPTAYQGGTQATDTVDGVAVTQQVYPVANPATGKPDTAMIKYTFKNTTSSSVTAGARVMVDTMIGNNDGAPFRVPGVGPVTTTQTWSGQNVPTSFQVFHDLQSADQIAEARFRGDGRTAPNKIESAYWPDVWHNSSLWDYSTDGSDMTADTAFLAYYNPKSLAPGASYSVAFSYGLGSVTTSTVGALSIGLTGPAALTLNGDGTGYGDSPFDAVGTISDSGTGPLNNVKVTLHLPPELSTTDNTTISLGTINPSEADKQTTWSVSAAPQTTAKDVSYSMTVTADGGLTKTVTRTVHLPAVQAATSSPTSTGSPTSTSTATATSTGSPTSTTTAGPTSTATATGTSTVTGPPIVTDGSNGGSGWGPAAWFGGGLLLVGGALAGAGRRLRRR